MDLPGADKALRLRELRGRFGDGCVDFTPTLPAEDRAEALGVCSEPLMEAVLATGTVPQADLITAITRRQVFPCYCGAALRLDGIDAVSYTHLLAAALLLYRSRAGNATKIAAVYA